MNYDYKNPRYLVFLDVDGVFTSARAQYSNYNFKDIWNYFDPVAINFMNKIHNKTEDVYFVLSSTWKESLDMHNNYQFQWVLSSFRNAGFQGDFCSMWKTNPDNKETMFGKRAEEIKEHLKLYNHCVKDFIIFDDNNYNFDSVLGKKRFVKTDPENGLLMKHMKHAMSIVGAWS